MVMLARSAEDLYWMGRYLERCEQLARTIDVTHHRVLESPPDERERCWVDALTMNGFDPGLIGEIGVDHGRLVDHCLLDDAGGAARHVVRWVRENSRGNREHLPIELWEEINRFYLEVDRSVPAGGFRGEPHEFCTLLRRRCQGILGTAEATWMRDDPWWFFTTGRLVERAMATVVLLSARRDRHTRSRPHEWTTTLRCATALQAHRRLFTGYTDARSLVALLVFSESTPRSIEFCLRHVVQILGHLGAPAESVALRTAGRRHGDLRYGDAFDLDADQIGVLLDDIAADLRRLDAAIAAEFFLLPVDAGLQSLRLGAVDSLGEPV